MSSERRGRPSEGVPATYGCQRLCRSARLRVQSGVEPFRVPFDTAYGLGTLKLNSLALSPSPIRIAAPGFCVAKEVATTCSDM